MRMRFAPSLIRCSGWRPQLPFQAVEEIVEFRDDVAEPEDDGRHRWLKIQASQFVQDGDRYLTVAPVHVIAFSTDPEGGSGAGELRTGRVIPDMQS